MKNLKKILALAVAFVMCFTMFAGALVFSDVPAGGDYSQAITFLSDLGVIAGKPDGTFGVNDAITRADAACLIARLMTGQTNPPKNDGTVQFTDVPSGSYYESAVGYCVALGITVGTGNGQYSPLRTITDGEFVAMLTRAMGYDTAEHPLAFPMGNITTAQQRGLLYGVNVDYASDALRGEDAQMLYNAMFAEYDRAASNKNTFQAADDHWDVTIAEEVFGLGRLSHDLADRDDSVIGGASAKDNGVSFHGANRNNNPTLDCDAHTWVIAGVDARYDENTYIAFAIDDVDEKAIPADTSSWSYQEFTYDGDITPLLGYRVELWGEYDHSGAPWDVSAIKVVDGNMTGSRAAASAFQSRYDANQAMYTYTPDMYTDDDEVVIDGKTLYVDDDRLGDRNYEGRANVAKINLDINTAARWMWRTEEELIPDNVAIPGAAYAGWDDTFAFPGPYTNHADAYRLARATANTTRNPLDNTLVHMNFADGDQYKLFDWNGDDYIDFVVVDTAKYAEVVTKTSSRMVLEADDRNINATTGVRSRGEYSLKLDDDNLKVEGADSVEEGDVIEITVVSRVYDREDKEIVTIKVAPVEPEVKKLEKINVTRREYTFDGEVIDLAQEDLFDVVELRDNGQSMDDLNTIENIGKEFNLWFDRNGFLIKARVNDDSASGYLMILETLDGQNNLHTSSTAARRNLAVADVLFDDNTVGKEVEFVANLTIDGNNDNTTGYDRSTRSWNEKMVVGNVYKYYMNDDDQITRLTSMTDNQFADYNFDDSKDRLGVSSGTYSRNYGFTDGAVVFAVKSVTTDLAADEQVVVNDVAYLASNDNNRIKGYVRQEPHNAGQGSGTHVGGPTMNPTVHYWVDPADVMAVSVDDVPEIDNRRNNGTWAVPTYEVTHPDRFITWDGTVAGTSFAADDQANTKTLPNFMTDAGKWIGRVTPAGWNLVNTADENSVYNNRAIPAVATPVESTQTTIPSVAFGTNRDDEIEAAVLGVDSLQFFGAGSIKLALISNVYAVGSKTYEFKAAIDGKYDTFKTIAGDEEDLFKGTLGDGTQNSYNNMRSYLNQSADRYTGDRNALYAEVILNSDGLIREVRAMSVVDPVINKTYWGDDPVQTQFIEGNVYRVIRGVTTQLLSKNLVTWQTSPMASSTSTLYPLTKYDDNNGYDHLEASYDEDTKFYRIDQNVPMRADERTLIGMGFRSDIDGDIDPADSGVLTASVFSDGDSNATYYFYDFAVYKNDMDRLASVFAFKDDGVTNSGTTADSEVLTAGDVGKLYTTTANGFVTSDNTGVQAVGVGEGYTIEVAKVSGTAEPVTITVKYNNGVDKDIHFTSTTGLNGTADELKKSADWPTGVTASVKNNVVTLATADAADKLSVTANVPGYTFNCTKIDAVPAKANAVSTLTIARNNYRIVDTLTFKVTGTDGSLSTDPVTVTLNVGTYSADDIARVIYEAVRKDAHYNGKVTVSGRTVTFTEDVDANKSIGVATVAIP